MLWSTFFFYLLYSIFYLLSLSFWRISSLLLNVRRFLFVFFLTFLSFSFRRKTRRGRKKGGEKLRRGRKNMMIGLRGALLVAVVAIGVYCFLYPSILFGQETREERSGFHCSPEELRLGEQNVFPVKAIKRFSEKLYDPTWGYFFARNSLDNWKHYVAHSDLYELEDATEWPMLSKVDNLESTQLNPLNAPSWDRVSFLSFILNWDAQTFRILQWIPSFVFDTFPGFVLRIPTIQR